jgi:hypothetical protein
MPEQVALNLEVKKDETKADVTLSDAAKEAANTQKIPEQLAAEKAAIDSAAGGVQETPEQKIEKEKEIHQNRVQKRIDKLTAEKYQLKGELEATRRLIEQRQPQQQTDEPVRENFDSDLAYLEARQDYRLNKIAADRDEQSRQVQQTAMQATWTQRKAMARVEHPDYDEVIADGEDIIIPRAAGDAIATSELGAELHYYLAKNPQEAAQLLQKTNPVDQIRVIGQIEAKIMAAKTTPKPKPTAAPAPLKPIGGGGGSIIIDPNKLSNDEWFKRDKEERLRKAGIKT